MPCCQRNIRNLPSNRDLGQSWRFLAVVACLGILTTGAVMIFPRVIPKCLRQASSVSFSNRFHHDFRGGLCFPFGSQLPLCQRVWTVVRTTPCSGSMMSALLAISSLSRMGGDELSLPSTSFIFSDPLCVSSCRVNLVPSLQSHCAWSFCCLAASLPFISCSNLQST